MKIMIAIVAALGIVLSSCRERPPVSGCTPNATRCARNVVELCVMSQRWEVRTDCDTVQPAPFVCAMVDAQDRQIATCIRGAVSP